VRLLTLARLPHPRRSSRLEPSAPERISARVASRPKKTYAEDDVFSDDDDFRDGGLGACTADRMRTCSSGTRSRCCVAGRVIEDRRFGIYDSRRYRLPDGARSMPARVHVSG
jgi:hypothetical protein